MMLWKFWKFYLTKTRARSIAVPKKANHTMYDAQYSCRKWITENAAYGTAMTVWRTALFLCLSSETSLNIFFSHRTSTSSGFKVIFTETRYISYLLTYLLTHGYSRHKNFGSSYQQPIVLIVLCAAVQSAKICCYPTIVQMWIVKTKAVSFSVWPWTCIQLDKKLYQSIVSPSVICYNL